MTTSARPEVRLVAEAGDHEMLAEWLLAAGYDAVEAADEAADDAALGPICSLLRWPAAVELAALPAPVIALYEPGSDVRPLAGRARALVEWPDSRDVGSLLAWSRRLHQLLREATEERWRSQRSAPAAGAGGVTRPLEDVEPPASCVEAPALIAIGISTGGPGSLRELFAALPRDRRLPPLVVVQHIPAGFVEDLVARLRAQTGYDVRFAADGLALERGVAYVAPGDRHLRVALRDGALFTEWSDAPPIRGHKPAVDELFASCAEIDRHGVAVIMTGMGRDGAETMRALRARGWETVGQDEETCVIYGMPRAARECGAVKRQLPLDRIASWLVCYCRGAPASAR
ncbi:MAG: CheB methylesterase domain-containing protein [Planctomycetota bacterium]